MRLFIILSFVFPISCSDESKCIEEMKKEFIERNQDRTFTGISVFELDGEEYYIFDDGVAFDAIATVVNSQCEEVCNFGGFRANSPLPCDEYQGGINRARPVWPD